MKIAILGYGVEGKSVEEFLKNEFPAARIEIRDVKIQRKGYLKGLEKFDLVVRSPGIPYLSPEIRLAEKRGVKITSTTKLFFRSAKGFLIGITGTKGKGTTSTLIYNILKAAKRDVHLIGNMGIPMLDELPKLKANSVSILELSSFQLQDLDISPHIAVVLDVSPDHLNYHKSMKEYVSAKAELVKNPIPKNTNLAKPQVLQDLAQRDGASRAIRQQANMRVLAKFGGKTNVFFFLDNKYSKQIAQMGKGKKIAVKADKNLKLKIPGFHNLKNASMAAAISRALGVGENIIKKTILNFKGLPHRLEFVREINGVKFYNDSASTNPAATIAALKAFKEPKILISGGAGKNLDYGPIGDALKNSNTKLIILNGQNRKEIGNAILGRAGGKASPTINIIYVKNLGAAVRLAFKRATNGDVIILSPASTAFDQFSGYGARGEYFKKIVAKF